METSGPGRKYEHQSERSVGIRQYIRTDYNKLRHLIHVDKTFGENASVVQEIVEKGSTTGIIANSFPAEDIIKPENFKSLLYY